MCVCCVGGWVPVRACRLLIVKLNVSNLIFRIVFKAYYVILHCFIIILHPFTFLQFRECKIMGRRVAESIVKRQRVCVTGIPATGWSLFVFIYPARTFILHS